MKEIIDKIKSLRLEEIKHLEEIESKRERLKNNRYWETYIQTLYEKVLYEDDMFLLKVNYDVKNGLNITFDNKTDKYQVYHVFGSFSWFNEWVEKIHESIEITDFTILNEQLQDDYSNVEDVIKSIDERFNNEFVLKRYKSLFDFISGQVKIILRS